MPDLHARLLAEIERREQVAEFAAAGGRWFVELFGDEGERRLVARVPGDAGITLGDLRSSAVADHAALHDPADALRRYAAARRVLGRHAPIIERPYRKPKCRHAQGAGVSWVVDWPCPDVEDLADSLGIDLVDGGEVR